MLQTAVGDVRRVVEEVVKGVATVLVTDRVPVAVRTAAVDISF